METQIKYKSLASIVSEAVKEDGTPVVSVRDYYDDVILPVRTDLAGRTFRDHKQVVCPFHDDTDPSLGTFKPANAKVELFGCFGCNSTGNVVRMHQLFRQVEDNVRLSMKDAAKELAAKYDIKLSLQYDDGVKVVTGVKGYFADLDRSSNSMRTSRVGETFSKVELQSIYAKMYGNLKEGRVTVLDNVNDASQIVRILLNDEANNSK